MKSQKTQQRFKSLRPYGYLFVYSLIALTVLLPLLRPGYILTLDMVFTPELPLPEQVTSGYLFWAALHFLNVLIPSQIIQKLLLFFILFLAGVGVHRLIEHLRPVKIKQTREMMWGTYLAGMFYMINPFTYSRFMAGQYLVVLGYALMPFFVRTWLQFMASPSWRTTLRLTLWILLISIVSVHTVGLLAVVILIGLGFSMWRYRQRPGYLRAITKYGLAGLVIFVLASSYWLFPLLLGQGQTAETIAGFGKSDQEAFATVGDGVIGQVSNVIRLQGFWPEGRGVYVMPQDRMPVWGLVMVVIWALVVIGGKALWRSGKRFETLLLGVSAFVAMLLSVGDVSGWITAHVPLFDGYREPHKFVGLVALMYAVFISQEINQLIMKYQKRFHQVGAYGVIAVVMVVLVACTPTMFWGFSGQLQPHHYPPDWFVINERLNQDKDDFQVLFLPWHFYMHYNFADRIIASPADNFFDKPTIVSNDPEFDDVSLTSSDPIKRSLSRNILPRAGDDNHLGAKLASLDIKYIVLAKEDDYETYSYLGRQKDLQFITESVTLKVYRNGAWGN